MTTLTLETCRVAFDLRKPDARRRARDALLRAERNRDAEEAQALFDLLELHCNRRLDPDDLGPTPELVVHRRHRQRGDTIEALMRTQALGWRQQAAALQIANVCQAITAALWARGAKYEQGHVDGGVTGAIPEHLACLYQRRYLPWARWMRAPTSMHQVCMRCGTAHVFPGLVDACRQCGSKRLWRARPHLPLVLTIVVYGGGFEDCARNVYHMRPPRALRLLRLGLDRYSDFAEEDQS